MNRDWFKTMKLNSHGLLIFSISIFLVIFWFYIQGDMGIYMGDEGYLWHNSLKVFNGYVPVKDFRSYDPGRYYWNAFWFMVMGDSGLLSLRFSCVLFQVVGLFCGLLVVKRIVKGWWGLILFGILLMISLSPRHKCFEISVGLIALLMAVRLIEKPTVWRHFAVGCVAGLAAFFAKNFGIYFLISYFFLILFIHFKTDGHPFWSRLGMFCAGMFVGYLPEFYLIIFTPGFFASFIDSVLRLFSPYAPVKSLPIPWPWLSKSEALPSMVVMKNWILGTSYLVTFGFYVVGMVLILFYYGRKKIQSASVFIASVFIGIPLLHHMSVRAGVSHFFQGIQLFLIGMIALIVLLRGQSHLRMVSIPLMLIFGLVSCNFLFSDEITQAKTRMDMMRGKSIEIKKFPIKKDIVWLDCDDADYFWNLTQFFSSRMRSDENVLIAPMYPGLYCLLNRYSPVWDSFPIHVATVEEQNGMIRDMEARNVNWAIISNRSMDGRSDRRFDVTHEIVWRYINKMFQVVRVAGIREDLQVFHRRLRSNFSGNSSFDYRM